MNHHEYGILLKNIFYYNYFKNYNGHLISYIYNIISAYTYDGILTSLKKPMQAMS
jgi:hypothetical protein